MVSQSSNKSNLDDTNKKNNSKMMEISQEQNNNDLHWNDDIDIVTEYPSFNTDDVIYEVY